MGGKKRYVVDKVSLKFVHLIYIREPGKYADY